MVRSITRQRLSFVCLILLLSLLPIVDAVAKQNKKRITKHVVPPTGKDIENTATYDTFEIVINKPVPLGLILGNFQHYLIQFQLICAPLLLTQKIN